MERILRKTKVTFVSSRGWMPPACRIFSNHKPVLTIVCLFMATGILLLQQTYPLLSSSRDVDVDEFLRLISAVRITAAQRERVLQLVARVKRVLREHRIRFFLCCGSAIGAARHQDLVPFDDDFDIHISDSDRMWLAGDRNVAHNLAEAGLSMTVHSRFSKLFFRNPDPRTDVIFQDYPYRWPFVDLMPFYDNGTHIRGKNYPQYPHDIFVYNKAEVFPLGETEVGGLRLPVMRCWRTVLERQYPGVMDRCCTGDWNHRKEEFLFNGRWAICVACRDLYEHFPFVVRLNASTEALLLGGRVKRVVRNEEPLGCRALQ